MALINEPKYDSEPATKSYVDRLFLTLDNTLEDVSGNLITDIANINKVYGSPPTPPYYVGNLYVDGTNLYRCKQDRLIGSFNPSDWELATEYPTSSYVDSTYTKPSDFALTGSVSVNGGRIIAGSIKSAHYVPNSVGMSINLDTDTIDSKNFKVDSEGNITAKNGNFEGDITSDNVNITGGQLVIGNNENFKVTNSGVVTAKSITLGAGSINWGGFNKPTKNELGTWTTWLGPDGIYTGTLTASQVNAVGISATSIVTGTFNADNVTITNLRANKITSGGTLSGSTVNIGSGYGGGTLNVYTNPGFLVFSGKSGSASNHPYASALNVARGAGGISFRNSGERGDAGSQVTALTANNPWLDCSTGFQAKGNINTDGGNFRVLRTGSTYTGKQASIVYKGSNNNNYYMKFIGGILYESGSGTG